MLQIFDSVLLTQFSHFTHRDKNFLFNSYSSWLVEGKVNRVESLLLVRNLVVVKANLDSSLFEKSLQLFTGELPNRFRMFSFDSREEDKSVKLFLLRV